MMWLDGLRVVALAVVGFLACGAAAGCMTLALLVDSPPPDAPVLGRLLHRTGRALLVAGLVIAGLCVLGVALGALGRAAQGLA